MIDFSIIRSYIDDMEGEYDKMVDDHDNQITTLKEDLEEKNQIIAELEEQINEIPTEPAYAR